jgi:membrane protein implicated in regulation of membrane protease activity
MAWWSWLLLGIALLVVELLTPGGFFVLFFGAGAIAVGVLVLVGMAEQAALQWLLFSILSIVALVVFRKPLLARVRGRQPAREIDSLIGETAVALSEIPVDAIGRAELRGSAWAAQNIGSAPVQSGQRCRVERVDGLTLHIRG